MNRKIKDYIFMIAPFAFYIIFAFVQGYNTFLDSLSYIKMHEMREPLYPTFIALIRVLFSNGTDSYLFIVVLVQAILAGYTVCNLTKYFSKELKLNDVFKALLMCVFFGVSILNGFIAKRGAMYSNSIMSEGIAYPMFLLCFRYTYEYLVSYKNKPLIIATVLSLLLGSTRKQMFVAMILVAVSAIYVGVRTKSYKQTILKILLVLLCAYGGSKVIDRVYINTVFKVNATHTSDNRFLDTMIFYNADREDGELIKDEMVKKLYYDIWDTCYEKGYLKCNTNVDSWYERNNHFASSYDNIQLRTMWDKMKEYAGSNSSYSDIEMELEVDRYNNVIISSLLQKVWKDVLLTIIDSFFFGLLITISAEGKIFMPIATIVYVLYLTSLFMNVRKNGINKTNALCIFTLLSVVFNVGLVSTFIFCQTRYTIYNMPLFYISFLILLIDIFLGEKTYEE